MCLTIYYDGQFWVGVFEERGDGGLFVSRHVFGAEPSDIQVLELVRQMKPGAIFGLGGISAADHAAGNVARANPKRLAREAARALAQRGVSTRSQEALQRQREEMKTEARSSSREQREEERERRRETARRKALKRHQGH